MALSVRTRTSARRSRHHAERLVRGVEHQGVHHREGPPALSLRIGHAYRQQESSTGPPPKLSVMTRAPGRPEYPHAPRLDLVEHLHGFDVADPYRWLEDPDDPATKQWSAVAGRAARGRSRAVGGAGRAPHADRRAARRGRGVRADLAGRAAVLHAPHRRAGARRAPHRRPRRHRAHCSSTRWRWTLSGLTTLDTWQPTKEGHLLAYQVSEGGTEESVLRVIDVVTGALVDGPIDRARYSPVAWLPGAEAYYYVRRLAPDARARRRGAVPPPGVAAPRRAPTRARTCSSSARDASTPSTTASQSAATAAGCRSRRRRAPRRATTSSSPTCRRRRWSDPICARSRSTSTPRPGSRSAATAGCWSSPTSTPRGAGSASRLRTRSLPTDWRPTCCPRTRSPCSTATRSSTAASWPRPVLLASWTRHAVSEVTVHDLATGARLGEVPLPGLGSVGGIVERPEGGHEAWFGYTDHTTPSTVQHYDARTGTTSLWATAPGAVDVPAVTDPPGHLHLGRRHRGAHVRHRHGRRRAPPTPSRPDLARPSSTATAASACR